MEGLSSIDWQALFFLRPYYLWALLLLPLFWLLFWRAKQSAGAWSQWVDAALQAHVLTAEKQQRSLYKLLWLSLLWVLAVIAIAGPSWQQRPTPLLRSEQARIVILDLSRSMLAADLKPSRLALARLKLQDLLLQSRDGKAGLLVFAAQTFPIAPLTDDIQTLLAQVPSLHPDLMPAQGGRIDRALLQAQQMLKNGGAAAGGQVVLISDSKPQEAAFLAAQQLRDAGYELSVLAVGTPAGAPIPNDSRSGRGFVKDAGGNIVIAKLPMAELRQLALAGGGRFSLITADGTDIDKLSKELKAEQGSAPEDDNKAAAGDQWLEAGPYLLLLMLPLAALGFRRGWLMAFVFVVSLPQSPPLMAEGLSEDKSLQVSSDWWANADQRGLQLLEQGRAKSAIELFKDPDWRAAAAYRDGQYQVAAEAWAQQEKPEALYNLGNALAQSGQLEQALAAWQQLPEEHALYPRAQENAAIIKKLLESQQQKQGDDSQQSDQQQQQDQDSQSQQSQADQNSDNQPQQDQQGQQQQSQDSQQSAPEEQAEQEQAEQEQAEQEQQESEAAQQEGQQESQPEPGQAPESEQAEQTPQLSAAEKAELDAQEQAQEQVIEQWLNRVPDDPGALLREKFKRDYQRRVQQRGSQYQDEEQAW